MNQTCPHLPTISGTYSQCLQTVMSQEPNISETKGYHNSLLLVTLLCLLYKDTNFLSQNYFSCFPIVFAPLLCPSYDLTPHYLVAGLQIVRLQLDVHAWYHLLHAFYLFLALEQLLVSIFANSE